MNLQVLLPATPYKRSLDPRCLKESSIRILKEQKHAIIRRFARADNVKASTQVLTTLASLVLLWWAALLSVHVSYWLTAVAVSVISLFTVRAFAVISYRFLRRAHLTE